MKAPSGQDSARLCPTSKGPFNKSPHGLPELLHTPFFWPSMPCRFFALAGELLARFCRSASLKTGPFKAKPSLDRVRAARIRYKNDG